MLVSERFEGSRTPFEGDRQLILRSLPEGAQVTKATLLVEPVAPPGGVIFEERIDFAGDQGDWGARKLETTSFAEVDFHIRRTLSSVLGSGLNGASLQVDLGGLYVPINELGAMSNPEDGVNDFSLPDAAGGLLPSLATAKFKLTLPAAGNPHITRVGIRSAPSNLTLRLEGGPPFWARPGELARTETVPDFSVILNAFLTEAEAQDGYYEIPLTIHSDSLCRLDLTVEIDFVQSQAALPGGLNEAALSFDYSTLSTSPPGLVTVRLPAGARVLPGQTGARVRGSFADSRIVCGPTGLLESAGTVKITPERAQAAPLVFTENLPFTTIDLMLTSVSRTAELALDLVEDTDGKPFTQSVLPSQVRLAIDSQVQGKPTWVNASLPVEVQVKAGVRLWLVVQSLRGEAEWSVATQAQVAAHSASGVWTAGDAIAADESQGSPLGMQYTDTGGLSWRAESLSGVNGPLVGFLHLRQAPPSYQVPIELQVGQGDAAQRVSLQRFEPLGRVDFSLDFAEVAEAINQVASASTAAVPQGELLLNNDFEAWHRVGDTPPDTLVRFPVNRTVSALAAGPDGKTIFISIPLSSSIGAASNIFASSETTFLLAGINEACLEPEGFVLLPASPALAIAVSPDGRRVCVSTANTLIWVDVEQWQVIGFGQTSTGAPFLDASPGRGVFSPDGSRLYVRRYFEPDDDDLPSAGSILFVDVERLESKLLENAPFNASDIVTGTIDLGDNIEPVDLVVSSDGSRLYVLTADHNSADVPASVRSYDPATRRIVLAGVPVGTNPLAEDQPVGAARGGVALSRDGRRLVAVNSGSASLAVLALPRGIPIGQEELTGDPQPLPVAVEMHPDGNYAVVADYRNSQLIIYDIARLGVVDPRLTINLNSHPAILAALPGGERIFASCHRSEEGPGLVALPMGVLVPEEWSLTAGRVQRLCAPAPFRLAAVLGDFFSRDEASFKQAGALPARRATAISQVMPVAGGANYALNFWGVATTSEAVAEIIWYGGNCSAQQVDSLEFTTFDADPRVIRLALELSILSGGVVPEASPIVLHRLAAVAPAGAEMAEVRFSVPAREAAVVDLSSFQATSDALVNGDMQQLDQGRLAGWTLAPSGASGVLLTAEEGGLRFRNGGAASVALEQAAGFPAQSSYELTFSGRLETASAGAEPLLELTFTDEAGQALGSPLSAAIGAQGSDQLVRRGESPAGTAAALVRLVVPSGVSLLVQQVALEEVVMVEVPLNFVAQAPGDLNISDLRVVYDRAPAAPPRRPPTGIPCPPTPPAGASEGRGCCYCPCCGETDELCNAHETETPGGQPAVEGECCHCGSHQQHIGGGAAAPATTATVPPVSAGGLGVPTRPTVVAAPTRVPAPTAVLSRIETRGAAPIVVGRAGSAGLRLAGAVLERRTAAAGGAVRIAASAIPPAVRELFTSAPPSLTILQPSAPSVGEQPAPSPAGSLLPPISAVTGVTSALAARLASSGLGELDRLAEATPSQISAALSRRDMQTARRISRNARRLFKSLTS